MKIADGGNGLGGWGLLYGGIYVVTFTPLNAMLKTAKDITANGGSSGGQNEQS